METTLQTTVGGKPLTIQTGKLAKQASGSVVVQYGETIVLVTAVSANEERISDFLPLTVEYQEKIYAAGRIPGNYFRTGNRQAQRKGDPHRPADRPAHPAACFPRVTATRPRSSPPSCPWTRKTTRTRWP